MNPETALRDEIHQALDAVGGRTPDLIAAIAQRLHPSPRRRPLLAVGQAIAVLGLAVVIGVVVLSMHRSRITPSPVTSPTVPIVVGPAASIAWVSSQTADGGEVVTGIDQQGHIVGRINGPVDLRSPDGEHLYAVRTTEVDVFSALDGHQETTIRLQSVTNPDIEMVSADGRYLAVVGAYVPNPGNIDQSLIPSQTTLELVDLTSGRSLASVRIGSPGFGAAPIIVGAQAQHIYVAGDTVTEVAFDGSTLRVERQATSHALSTDHALSCNGLALGGENSGGGLPFRVLADGRTLVTFCPGDGRITWFDLVQMKVVHEITHAQANPFWVSPVFSPDGNTLYLHEGGTGALAAVDLVHQRIDKSTKVAMAGPDPLAWLESILVTPAYAGSIPRTVAVSPDGFWLYAVSIFEGPGGVSIVHVPDLSVKGRWLPDTSFDSVWVSADGQTIYLLTHAGNVLRLVRADGSLITTLTLPGATDGFLVPSIP